MPVHRECSGKILDAKLLHHKTRLIQVVIEALQSALILLGIFFWIPIYCGFPITAAGKIVRAGFQAGNDECPSQFFSGVNHRLSLGQQD